MTDHRSLQESNLAVQQPCKVPIPNLAVQQPCKAPIPSTSNVTNTTA